MAAEDEETEPLIMASVHSPVRRILKPLLFKLLGRRGYFHMQIYAKAKDIRERLVEEKEMELLPRLVGQGDHVLDIGANFAYYSTRLSGLVGGAGKVTAFEPIPFTHDVCVALLKKLGATNVELFQKGVGARDEYMAFSVPLQDFGAMSAGQAHMSERNNELEGKENYYSFSRATQFTCHVVALDDFLRLDDRPLSFVKIDIEGAEFYALQGMRHMMQEHRPVVLIEIQPFFLKGFGIEESALVLLIDQLGYDLFLYDEITGKLDRHDEALIDSNYLMIHRERSAEFDDILA